MFNEITVYLFRRAHGVTLRWMALGLTANMIGIYYDAQKWFDTFPNEWCVSVHHFDVSHIQKPNNIKFTWKLALLGRGRARLHVQYNSMML